MRVPNRYRNCGFAPVGIHDGVTRVTRLLRPLRPLRPLTGDLTTGKPGLKYVKFRRNIPSVFVRLETSRIYDLKVDLSSKS
jgi:hypothetical protein